MLNYLKSTYIKKLERYAMQYGKDSDEFKDLISTMPRDLSNIPEVIEKDLFGKGFLFCK